LGFLTADERSFPRLTFLDRQLELSYQDFANVQQTILFHNVLGFRWDENDPCTCIPCDRVYAVQNSAWLQRTIDSMTGLPAASHCHYKLGFNVAGAFLDVIAEKVERKHA